MIIREKVKSMKRVKVVGSFRKLKFYFVQAIMV